MNELRNSLMTQIIKENNDYLNEDKIKEWKYIN